MGLWECVATLVLESLGIHEMIEQMVINGTIILIFTDLIALLNCVHALLIYCTNMSEKFCIVTAR